MCRVSVCVQCKTHASTLDFTATQEAEDAPTSHIFSGNALFHSVIGMKSLVAHAMSGNAQERSKFRLRAATRMALYPFFLTTQEMSVRNSQVARPFSSRLQSQSLLPGEVRKGDLGRPRRGDNNGSAGVLPQSDCHSQLCLHAQDVLE